MWQPQGLFSQFSLRTPVVLSGAESLRGLYNYPGERFAVIHGLTLSEDDKALFRQVFKKKDVCFIKRSWTGEPTVDALSGSLKAIEEYQPDTLIAFGGGSVIDGTKLCRLYFEFPFYNAEHSRLEGAALKTRFIAVPTTIGSGAEVSSAAVYWNEAEHRKEMVVMHEFQPDVIVYDKRYVEHTPLKILCASALDGMSHIIEGYVSNVTNEWMELLGEKGLSIFRQALADSGAPDYARLQYAGYIGGIVQNHCIVGGAHAIAHQLTEYGFSHGEAVGLLLPSVINVNSSDSECAEKYNYLAHQAGFLDVPELTSFLERLVQLGEIGARRDELKAVLSDNFVSMASNIKDDRGGKGNPVPITDDYVKRVIWSL